MPANDPLQIVPAMAAATEHLGFGITASVSFEHPFPFARRMSTLDHLTRGRAGWNIVTSYLNSGARNLGLKQQLNHQQRYALAAEYLEVCYKLWEASWDDDAVVADRKSGVYADPRKVHPIEHKGEHFEVPGFHLSQPSPQRTPVLYQPAPPAAARPSPPAMPSACSSPRRRRTSSATRWPICDASPWKPVASPTTCWS